MKKVNKFRFGKLANTHIIHILIKTSNHPEVLLQRVFLGFGNSHPSLKVIGETIGDPFLKGLPESGKIAPLSQKGESPGRAVILEE